LLPDPPPQETGERKGRVKARKLRGQVKKKKKLLFNKYKRSRRGEKASQRSDAKAVTHHLPRADLMPSQLLSKRWLIPP